MPDTVKKFAHTLIKFKVISGKVSDWGFISVSAFIIHVNKFAVKYGVVE